MPNSLLIIEDERLLAEELARFFRKQGWSVELATSLADARRTLFDEGHEPLVILADMTLPDGNSLDLMETARQQARAGEWVLLTGCGGVPESVRALRMGAYDFLEKPCDLDRLGNPDRGAPQCPRPAATARPARGRQSPLRPRRLSRPQPGGTGSAAAAGSTGGGALQRPDHQRRDRDRKGAGGADTPPLGAAGRGPDDRGQLRGAPPGPDRIRAVRP